MNITLEDYYFYLEMLAPINLIYKKKEQIRTSQKHYTKITHFMRQNMLFLENRDIAFNTNNEKDS